MVFDPQDLDPPSAGWGTVVPRGAIISPRSGETHNRTTPEMITTDGRRTEVSLPFCKYT